MSGFALGLAVLALAWLADLIAQQWGFHGLPQRSKRYITPAQRWEHKRKTSKRLNGQHSASPAGVRKTGIRSA